MVGDRPALTVLETRGQALEAVHPVSAVVFGPEGVVLRVGPDQATTWRSAAKPFQLEASLSLLSPASVAALEARDLALGAASHSAQSDHVRGVRSLMERLGVPEGALRCGGHPPGHPASAEALVRSGSSPSPVHNNCSGKHTFMLAAQQAAGAPLADYLSAASPIQRRIAALVSELTGEPASTVVDGCSAPCFVLSLEGMARAWAQLALAFAQPDSGPRHRIARALHAEPWWMSGDQRLDHDLVRAARAPLLSKVGAAGLLCLALPEQGLGVALKIATGSDAVRPVAAQAVLSRLAPDLVPEHPFTAHKQVRNVVGSEVGARHAEWST